MAPGANPTRISRFVLVAQQLHARSLFLNGRATNNGTSEDHFFELELAVEACRRAPESSAAAVTVLAAANTTLSWNLHEFRAWRNKRCLATPNWPPLLERCWQSDFATTLGCTQNHRNERGRVTGQFESHP
jgi:hypothetical protein